MTSRLKNEMTSGQHADKKSGLRTQRAGVGGNKKQGPLVTLST